MYSYILQGSGLSPQNRLELPMEIKQYVAIYYRKYRAFRESLVGVAEASSYIQQSLFDAETTMHSASGIMCRCARVLRQISLFPAFAITLRKNNFPLNF